MIIEITEKQIESANAIIEKIRPVIDQFLLENGYDCPFDYQELFHALVKNG